MEDSLKLQFCRVLFGVDKSWTTAHSKEGNWIADRTNRILKNLCKEFA